jgi:hypothetical protein
MSMEANMQYLIIFCKISSCFKKVIYQWLFREILFNNMEVFDIPKILTLAYETFSIIFKEHLPLLDLFEP